MEGLLQLLHDCEINGSLEWFYDGQWTVQIGDLSVPDLQFLSGGGRSDRLEKTRAVSTLDVAQRHLNVCLYPKLEINCGRCGKCVRTLLTLEMVGALDKFRSVFPVDDYRRDRLRAFAYLIRERNSPVLPGVYEHFAEREPELMAEAQKLVDTNLDERLS